MSDIAQQKQSRFSFFRYPGGKAKLQEPIVQLLREQTNWTQYREPFFGGGAIGLNFMATNSTVTSAWLNDLDVGLASLWTATKNYPQELKNLVGSFEPSVPAFTEFKAELKTTDTMPIDRDETVRIGFEKLAVHQMSYSGLGTMSGGPLGGYLQRSNYKIDDRWSPDALQLKIDAMHEQLSKIEVRITHHDFAELITDTSQTALIYLDPPYYVNGNALYQNGFTKDDHLRLAELLKTTKHRWVLSYDDCPEVRALYYWAKIMTVSVNYSIAAPRREQELLICPPTTLKAGDDPS